MYTSVEDIDYTIKEYTDSKDSDTDICFLRKHSNLFGYTIYYTVSKVLKDTEVKTPCLIYEDYKRFIGKYIGNKNVTTILCTKECLTNLKKIDSEKVVTCVELPEKFFAFLKNSKAKNVETYILQRCLFEDDIPKPVKNIEFYSTFKIFDSLSDICVFKSQVGILGYRVDSIFTLTTKYLDNIPDVAVEIDENGHTAVGYSPERESDRQKIIEAFGNRVIRVKIPRNCSEKEIDDICSKESEKIRNIFNDLAIDYNPNVTTEQFLQRIKGCNVDEGFLNIFFKKSPNDQIFRYRHSEIGEWLGLNEEKNYRSTKRIIEDNLEFGIEYRKETKEETSRFASQILGSKNSVISTKDNRGGKNQVNFVISRLGLYLIVMNSKSPKAKTYLRYFAKVYEASMSLLQTKVTNIISDKKTTETKKEAVAKRIDSELKKKESKLKITKVTNENIALKENLEIVKNELDSTKKEFEEYKTLNENLTKDLRKKLEKANEKIEEILLENEKLKEVISKQSTKDPKKKGIKLEKIIRKMLITDLKKLCKNTRCIRGYSGFKSPEKESLETLILETIEKDENLRKKVINYLKSNEYM